MELNTGRLKVAEETPRGAEGANLTFVSEVRLNFQAKGPSLDDTLESQVGTEGASGRLSAKSLRYLRQRQGRRNLPSFLVGINAKIELEMIGLYEINSRILVITNNPSLAHGDHIIHLGEAGVLAVMKEVRGYLHKGHRLLTHPLAGSVKPNENPYKSIVITRQPGILDFESVSILEGAIKLAERMLRESPQRQLPAQVLADLALIDHSLLTAGLESLAASPWTI